MILFCGKRTLLTTAFAGTTYYVAQTGQRVPRRCAACPTTPHEGTGLFQTHVVTFLPENLSPHGEKACVNRSMQTYRTGHDVTTAYAAETPARAFRPVSKYGTEKSDGCAHLGLMT